MLLNLLYLSWTWSMAAACTALTSVAVYLVHRKRRIAKVITPVSVNYFFSRKCNKECAFCFHTEKDSYVASEDQMKHGLRLLKEAGSKCRVSCSFADPIYTLATFISLRKPVGYSYIGDR